MYTTQPLMHHAAASAADNVSAKHPLTSLSTALRQSWLSFRAYRAHRAAKAKLMALDDRALKDIGFDRSEIESVLTDRSGERRNVARTPIAQSEL